MRHLHAAALAATLLLSACGESEGDEGATMLPGSDCLSCHTGGEPGRFTAAGTVFTGGTDSTGAAGVTVTLTGSGGGQSVTLTTNAVGNFYTSVALTPPIGVAVAGNGGSVGRPSHNGGACGSCHAQGNQAGAPRRVHVGACGACHT
ncbi:MAG: hypothetical protein IPO09_09865 [Anaeromyxobacter sp.]|nr:hypothetical protein [Anaeromyxobacter sp.]MBL0278582.1 hypothetical protein [Anaeromyxobacter sp.]